MAIRNLGFAIFAILGTQVVLAGDYCNNFKWCDYGCCGDFCCDDILDLSTGAIIGVVIGGLLSVVLIIVGIVACCVCCIRAASTPPPRPVVMQTVAPTQPMSSITVQQAPPGYNNQSYLPQAPQMQQPGQPQAGNFNQGFQKDLYP